MKPAQETNDGFAPLDEMSLWIYLGRTKVSHCVAAVELFDELASANDYLLHEADIPADGRFRVCLAESQTAGRGRLGRRVWHSPKNGNLYLSVLRHAVESAQFMQLTLTVAVEIVRMFAERGVRELEVKPPNDIFCRGKKLGGVLVESKGNRIVVGLGLNVYPTGSDGAWTSLSEMHEEELDRNQVAAWMITAIVYAMDKAGLGAGSSFPECGAIRGDAD